MKDKLNYAENTYGKYLATIKENESEKPREE
jgi:hypothetical protein